MTNELRQFGNIPITAATIGLLFPSLTEKNKIRSGFVDTVLLGDGLHYPYRMDVKYAARKIVKAIEQHRHVAVIDGWYRLLTMFWRIVPRCLWRHLPIYCRKEVE